MTTDHKASAEDRLIARHFRPLAKHPGAFGLVDDAAVITPPAGHDVVLKTDAIIGGVHFFADDPPDSIARKALRVNLSDLAAKGARPAGFLLSLALPETCGDAWLAEFADGLGADAERYACPLLGGDTDRTPGPIMISIAAFGTLPHATMVMRSGAQVGDRIVVTGTIGDGALGVLLRKQPDTRHRWGLDARMSDHLIGRYRVPEPRNAIADALRRYASAAMDVSDGLMGDLAKLCRASGVSAEVESARVPVSEAAASALSAEPSLIQQVLTGGDDYEVLATVAPGRIETLRLEAAAVGVPLTEIGHVAAGKAEPHFIDRDGRKLVFERLSFSHF